MYNNVVTFLYYKLFLAWNLIADKMTCDFIVFPRHYYEIPHHWNHFALKHFILICCFTVQIWLNCWVHSNILLPVPAKSCKICLYTSHFVWLMLAFYCPLNSHTALYHYFLSSYINIVRRNKIFVSQEIMTKYWATQ